MRNKFTALFPILIALCLLFGANPLLHAEHRFNAVGDAESIIDGIFGFKAGGESGPEIQNWINSELANNAGISSEWYVLALCKLGKYDFSSYTESLEEYLSQNRVSSASSRLKYALSFVAAGYDSDYIQTSLNDSVGKLGVMSYIFSLHLYNNGYRADNISKDTIISEILSLQKKDGGWAVIGNTAEIDATAMAIQALAPYTDRSDIASAIDSALSMLSSRQLEDGDFSSYGTANPESTAQVIVALSSLGIDAAADARFIKNGNSLFDGLKKYMLSDGSFCHEEGKPFNENATVQAFLASAAYLSAANGNGPIYIFNSPEPTPNVSVSSVGSSPNEPTTSSPLTNAPITTEKPNTEGELSTPSTTVSGKESDTGSYKLPVCIAIIASALILCAILVIAKKTNSKNFILIWTVALLAIAFVAFTSFKSADGYYNGEDVHKENAIGKVSLTIRCDKALGKHESEYLPGNGVILEPTEFEIEAGDTVYDILIEAARKHKIQIDKQGASGSIYISGINYLYEFDVGDLSGWVFTVNGKTSSVGCDGYELSDGDSIEWHYSLEVGKDIG